MNCESSEIDAGPRARAAEALAALVAAARLAGEIALRQFRAGEATSARIDYKSGGSPVTSADLEVDAFLEARLRAEFPGAGWLSEETADDPSRLGRSELIIVDPIDGTRAFLSGDPRWTVSIALVVDGRPIAGVVHAPALSETFAASAGGGATLNGAPIRSSVRAGLDGARIAGPRPLVAALASAVEVEFAIDPKIPSLAYRLARAASGSLDIALASVNSNDWDIAGADIVLAESGGRLCGVDGRPIRYNRAGTRHDALVGAPIAWAPLLASALGRALASQRHET
jgi:myo-inositol-1(or 4)-monophosphatase